MGVLQSVNEQPRVPIGRITFHLQTSLYRKKDGEFSKVRDYIKIGETRDVFDVNGDYIEIQNGLYIKNIDEHQYTMTFGEIIVRGDSVRSCSKNGIILRKLRPGLKVKVVSLKFISNDVTVFGINEKEFISSDEDVQYVMGIFEFGADSAVLKNGQSIKFQKGDITPYQRVEGHNLLLLDGTWLDISTLRGTLYGC
ncbi:hypothetical protein [Lysinibacillus fusiformis]|uniref:hypothetical protein n=1 Tax=Lysinibacillus fusiformis TaxID=28031 RepID=UPI0023A9FDD2|nr:hypothetical protein [Lysinibacillus fusiformis]WEA41698.1 hypothetical protein PWJ66_22775 [Lysinibacillus fusiformis]